MGGAKIATLAIVFTDIVDSTRLCADVGDSTWDSYRQRTLLASCNWLASPPGA